jgi:A/G-specific adenine glycosylase
MKRIAGSYDDISQTSVKKELWKDIISIIPEDRPGDFNQSLMELGATVCLPNGKPLCDKCPVIHLCKAFHEDITMQLPVKPGKKERRKEDKTILLLEYQDRYAIRKRMAKGLLAGLWELPGIEEKKTKDELLKLLHDMVIIPTKISQLQDAKHIFSHVEWNMAGYHILLKEYPEQFSKEQSIVWADTSELNDVYSIPNAFMAFTKDIKEKKK